MFHGPVKHLWDPTEPNFSRVVKRIIKERCFVAAKRRFVTVTNRREDGLLVGLAIFADKVSAVGYRLKNDDILENLRTFKRLPQSY